MGMEEFLTVTRLLSVEGAEENGGWTPTAELIQQWRSDPDTLELEQSFREHLLKTRQRGCAERLFRLLFSTIVYISNLIDGPVPVLLPRRDTSALSKANGNGRGEALAVARSIERLIESQTAAHQQPRDEQLLVRIEDMVARASFNAVPASNRHLSTDQIAVRLNIAPKTARRLCNEGKIIARKLASGEWRTTQEDLDRSPYVMNKQRRQRAQMEH